MQSPVTDGGRNPSYEGRFSDETPEMHLIRLAQSRRIAALEAEKNPLECGHHESFAIFSSEEPEKLLFCEFCDIRQQRNDLLTDIDELKKKHDHEIYMIRADKAQTLIEAEKAMAQIREAVNALRADAERYRWLKECTNEQFDYLSNNWCGLDNEIDSMMKIERSGDYYASASVMKCKHVFEDDRCVVCGGVA